MTAPLKSGAVAVEILGNDANFHETLKRVERSLNGWGARVRNTIMTVGLTGSAFRTVFHSLTTPIQGLATEFAQVGETYAKMSKRTGIAASDLSKLGFAAEQSGAGVAELGNGKKSLQRNLTEASRGNKTALESFQRLGLDIGQLETMAIDEQFLTISEAIKKLGIVNLI